MKIYFLPFLIMVFLLVLVYPFFLKKFTTHFKVYNCSASNLSRQQYNCDNEKNPTIYGWEVKLAF